MDKATSERHALGANALAFALLGIGCAIVTIGLGGCGKSNELTREGAQALLMASPPPVGETKDGFRLGTFSISGDELPSPSAYEKAGLTATEKLGADKSRSIIKYEIRLTDEGKRYVVSETSKGLSGDRRLATVRVCEPGQIEVTGVTFIGPDANRARVDYSYTGRPTPWGEAHPADKPNCAGGTGEATLQLYDDGWRVVR